RGDRTVAICVKVLFPSLPLLLLLLVSIQPLLPLSIYRFLSLSLSVCLCVCVCVCLCVCVCVFCCRGDSVIVTARPVMTAPSIRKRSPVPFRLDPSFNSVHVNTEADLYIDRTHLSVCAN